MKKINKLIAVSLCLAPMSLMLPLNFVVTDEAVLEGNGSKVLRI